MEIKLYKENKAYEWQKKIHNDITELIDCDYQRMVIIKAARQRYGKSEFAKAELIRFSLKSKEINAYVSPTLKLATKMYNEIIIEFSEIIKKQNGKDLIIEFINGSIIRFFSGEMGIALRGFTVTGVLVIDEAAFIKDDVYYELLASWCTVHKALTIIISTPQYLTGFFYEFYLEGLMGRKEFTTYDWIKDYDVPFDELTLSLKNKMPNIKWNSEYLGQFIRFESSVFGEYKHCILKDKPSFNKLYWGLDFATGSDKDYTVLTAFNELGEQCYVWRVNDMPPNEQINKIADILTEYKDYTKKINAEVNSIGKVYIDLLKKKIKNITSFVTTNDSKRKLVENFQTAIENHNVKILNDAALLDEISFFEAARNHKTNKITYNAKSGHNDDFLMATLLAYDALKTNFKISYSIV